MGLPLLGNATGWIAAKIFRQSREDTIAIAIETGVQNTGMTMFLVTFALEQPAADITMIIPIAVSIATPLPLVLFAIIDKIRKRLVYFLNFFTNHHMSILTHFS